MNSNKRFPLHTKTVLVIAGPTAVGKTAFAIEAARHLGTSIISADSRQCFQELNIGVAKPSDKELQTVHHYFINSHSITQEVNAGTFEQYALQAAQAIFQDSHVAVMVGGTGLYIKAFCEGIDQMPAIPDTLRQQIIGAYEQQGLPWLQQQLQTKDPAFWQVAEQQNPQRLMRALEVVEATGQSILHFRTHTQVQRPFNIIKWGLELPRTALYDRINQRVDTMVQQGLVQEVEQLLPYRHLNALQTVGYRELFDYFDGNCTLHKAIENIKQNTRHYAKRQMTWFKKDPSIQWVQPQHAADLLHALMTKNS
jgi:tRNA dimethylallyltransferase